MSKHRWSVGLLSEMPPEGKVGVSPVCILGVNINAGQEISLRLRTDDLKGFRRYDSLAQTEAITSAWCCVLCDCQDVQHNAAATTSPFGCI